MTTTAGLVPMSASKRLGPHHGGLENFVCVNGHLHGTCWLVPLSSNGEDITDDDDEYQSKMLKGSGKGSSSGEVVLVAIEFGLSESSNNGVNKAPATPTSRDSKLSRGVTKSDPSSLSPQPNSRLSIDWSPRSVESKLTVDRKSSRVTSTTTPDVVEFSAENGDGGEKEKPKVEILPSQQVDEISRDTELPSESRNGNPKYVCQSVQGEAKMWESCKIGENNLLPEKEHDPESFEGEVDSKADEDSFDRVNGLSSTENIDNGNSLFFLI
ncbi:hypothetical protein GIB67_026296 [Kingdonia uniflora]|uniref:Uncharacterized protein n=1 Tax=Kingdonia uniflora TaxID=39325 RepID=A0A7J7N6C9_9MAGN|nr:hypothetical protein GIB67_026296 [Kingdonia uniflora]